MSLSNFGEPRSIRIFKGRTHSWSRSPTARNNYSLLVTALSHMDNNHLVTCCTEKRSVYTISRMENLFQRTSSMRTNQRLRKAPVSGNTSWNLIGYSRCHPGENCGARARIIEPWSRECTLPRHMNVLNQHLESSPQKLLRDIPSCVCFV